MFLLFREVCCVGKERVKRLVGYGFLLLFVAVFFVCSVGSVSGYWDDKAFSTDGAKQFNFPQGVSLIFQLDKPDERFGATYPYLALNPVDTDFNCSGDVFYGDGVGGRFLFVPDNNVDVEVTFNHAELGYVMDGASLEDGETYSLVAGTTYVIVWSAFEYIVQSYNINVGVNAVIICIVLFAPAVGLFLITKTKWAILMGMTVGCLLGYFMLPLVGVEFPLWILFAMFFVIAMMFLAMWRSGG